MLDLARRPAPACTADHAALKASDIAWAAGTRPIPSAPNATIDDGEHVSVLANCRACHSTIARAIGPSKEAR